MSPIIAISRNHNSISPISLGFYPRHVSTVYLSVRYKSQRIGLFYFIFFDNRLSSLSYIYVGMEFWEK